MTPNSDEPLDARLREVVQQFDCVAGTLHRAEGGELRLVTHERIPEPVLERIETVPFGKGMAGIAAERREPVQVCNLQSDTGGVAEDGARETNMEGAIAAPLLDADGEVAGTIGVAKVEPYEFSSAERDELLRVGEGIADRI